MDPCGLHATCVNTEGNFNNITQGSFNCSCDIGYEPLDELNCAGMHACCLTQKTNKPTNLDTLENAVHTMSFFPNIMQTNAINFVSEIWLSEGHRSVWIQLYILQTVSHFCCSL